MLMELAYRLAVEDSQFIEDIRKNMIVMITPALEVDGRDRMVDLYNYRKANPGKPAPPPMCISLGFSVAAISKASSKE